MAARTMLNTAIATVETISATTFPSTSTIYNATVFHGVLLGRMRLSDIDFFLGQLMRAPPRRHRATDRDMARAGP
jgi:hypothetical protein